MNADKTIIRPVSHLLLRVSEKSDGGPHCNGKRAVFCASLVSTVVGEGPIRFYFGTCPAAREKIHVVKYLKYVRVI
jgi:hypothetical protein